MKHRFALGFSSPSLEYRGKSGHLDGHRRKSIICIIRGFLPSHRRFQRSRLMIRNCIALIRVAPSAYVSAASSSIHGGEIALAMLPREAGAEKWSFISCLPGDAVEMVLFLRRFRFHHIAATRREKRER